ncbi:MAG: aminodeoxychorismate/anthranilate synthase component II [Nanoarchaeota archaeon]|nr:aminodeoxychorismate/anthranilate synthase component II [Nanoarchaeota archaeon]
MKINYIDNYDSFANTIAAYFRLAGATVDIYKSDCSLETAVSGNPDMILLGPGPNGPKEAGNYMDLLDRYHNETPFFGICLGFQAMMEYFGQQVVPLDEVVHGASVPVYHNGNGIFRGIMQGQEFARYNSLGVYQAPDNFEVTATSNGTIMAAKHKILPIEGIQFHPESVLSGIKDAGMGLVNNVVNNLK